MQWIRQSPISTPVVVAAAASVGAGLVHAAAAGSHNGDATLAWLFALTAAAQLSWGALAGAWPRRLMIAAGAVLNGGAALAWLLSRTVGLFGPLAEVEPVGTQDTLAAVLGALAAVAALVALRYHAKRLDLSVAAVAAGLVVLLAVPAMAAEHTHGPSHDHDHGTTEVAAGHTHTDSGGGATAAHDHSTGASASEAAAGDPIVSMSDPRLTREQRQRATTLLNGTRAAMASFTDEASVVAAGYTSIGDGRKVGGFEHFVNAKYMFDGNELDPLHVESIVMQRQADGSKTIASAMYILEPGSTMANVPDIAGGLTPWHDHQNLCWEGNKLVGILVAGKCVPRGEFRATAPMIHVWMQETPCGPFTGIEGHGGGNCAHSHTSA